LKVALCGRSWGREVSYETDLERRSREFAIGFTPAAAASPNQESPCLEKFITGYVGIKESQ
jgi:hypothetical protein